MEVALSVLGVIIAIGVVYWVGMTAGRNNTRRDELEEWDGVMDVRRETRDKLESDPDYAKRVQDEFND